MSIYMQRVILRFKHPSGSCKNQPSAAMHEALMVLSDCIELQPLYCEAENTGKRVAIEVFHNRDGQPILIHFGKEDA